MEAHSTLLPLLLLLLLLLLTSTQLTAAARPAPPKPTNTTTTTTLGFIKTSCAKTTYPTLCLSSLSAYSSAIKGADPVQLANKAIAVSLTQAKTTSASISQLRLQTAALRPRVSQAVKDCADNMRATVDELRMSVAEMRRLRGPGDVRLHVNNIQTWVSAALTDENTCLDGFAGRGMDGAVKDRVRAQIVKVARLTSNALSLVNGVAQLL